jgi:hypothetical protein
VCKCGFKPNRGPLDKEHLMIEVTNLRIFSTMQYDLFGQCQGLLLIGADEQTAEVFYYTPWATEKEADRSLNARYSTLITGSPRYDNSRAEALTELDNLRSLCAERSALLDELAENESLPGLVDSGDALLGAAFGDTQISLLTNLIERSKRRLLTVVGETDI